MMSFDNFKQITKYSAPCQNRKLVIEEKDESSKLNEVEIIGFPSDDAIKFCFDGKYPLCPYLSDKGGHQRKCDGVMLLKYKDQNYLIFVEMKSESLDRKEIAEQFKSSQCFMDYCDSILKRFHKDDILQRCLKGNVVFYKIPFPKEPTKPPENEHCDPNKTLFIPYAEPVRIKKIISLLCLNKAFF